MKKVFLHVFTIVLLMQGCSLSDDFMDEQSLLQEETILEEIGFPKHIEACGKAVAKELEVTVLKMIEMGIDYSDMATTKDFREKFYEDWYNASPSMAKSRALEMERPTVMSSDEFAEGYNSLTELQLTFIRKIVGECELSKSNSDLLTRLIKVKEEISSQVPEIEQERLLTILSVLYYGVQEISYLEDQGYMLKTPYNNIKLATIKRREEGGGNIGDNCNRFLTTIWTIAVGEPTEFGEIVASIATLTYAGILYYEVVTCKRSFPTIDYCNEKYNQCMNGKDDSNPNSGGWGYSMCARCHEYCLAQGIWECPRPV